MNRANMIERMKEEIILDDKEIERHKKSARKYMRDFYNIGISKSSDRMSWIEEYFLRWMTITAIISFVAGMGIVLALIY